jgi:hypothetical protein
MYCHIENIFPPLTIFDLHSSTKKPGLNGLALAFHNPKLAKAVMKL